MESLFKSYNFIKKRLQHRCFPMNIAKFLKTTILKNICERLLLKVTFYRCNQNTKKFKKIANNTQLYLMNTFSHVDWIQEYTGCSLKSWWTYSLKWTFIAFHMNYNILFGVVLAKKKLFFVGKNENIPY